MFSQNDIYKLSLIEQHAKRVVTQKDPIGGINDFCDLVRLQQKNPNLSLQDAFETVVYLTKFN
tara:strand:+ start:227 stop:415 length:189 start_codon:yes stop_codon:yes gene_type:complete